MLIYKHGGLLKSLELVKRLDVHGHVHTHVYANLLYYFRTSTYW